jgi:hypothetical protein
MPVIDNPIATNFLLNSLFLVKVGFIILSVFYFFFTLVVVQQVRIITETVITEGGSLLRAIAIIYSGLSLGAIVLFFSFL